MSITNFINSEASTIIQGVNSIRLCQESWMIERSIKQTERRKPAVQSGGKHTTKNRACYL